MKNSELSFCDHSYQHSIIKSVGRGINKFDLIKADDRIAVGLSGGKDSLVLLETLALRRRHIPIHYDIIAIHVSLDNGLYDIDREFIHSFCNSLNVRYYEKMISVDLDEASVTPCFVCSRGRRKELFLMTRDLGCNKLALGHHMDDILETFFLNMTFNGAISTIPPKLSIFHGEFDIIRPLYLLNKNSINRYCAIRGFPDQKKECPYGDTTKREEIKKIIRQFEGLNEKGKQNIFNALSNIHFEYMPPNEKNKA